jgi:SAM domain (Sterile alpha motif)
MDLAVWLRSLGPEQYEAAFRENAITEKLLPSLRAEDLKVSLSLGIGVHCSTQSRKWQRQQVLRQLQRQPGSQPPSAAK